jgi:hypothetical protein
MRRAARLQAAPRFIAGYTGKRLVLGYAKWFGVDRLCAIRELRMLGVAVPESEVRAAEDALRAAQTQSRKRAEAKAQKALADREAFPDFEEYFGEWESEVDAFWNEESPPF